MKLYHGTNASNIFNVMDNARMTKNINGLGFYLTNDINTASRYGSKIICWIVDKDIPMIVRPIDQRYVEGLATYEECARGGMEYVVTTQANLNDLLLECDSEVVS